MLLPERKSVVALDERMHAGQWDKGHAHSIESADEHRDVGRGAIACASPAWRRARQGVLGSSLAKDLRRMCRP